jgi:spore coat polysaccharide biosynthesis protein SpsF (cytidylyltransferase family)
MKSGIVVQARNSSTRYPQKMLHTFLGKTAIEWVIDRCQKAEVDCRILATSVDSNDEILIEIARRKGWNVIRGSLNDVLNRYAKAIQEYKLDVVVRITGDCILTDYRLINHALKNFHEYKADYICLVNVVDGFDVEVVKANAILEADKHAKLPSEREHVTPYIRKNDNYKILYLQYGNENLSHIHLSLDYKADAIAIGLILERFNNIDFSYEDVVGLIKTKPHILDSVRHTIPNEGYRKSLEEDKNIS